MSVGIKGLLWTSLVWLISNGATETKLELLAFLRCREFVKKENEIEIHHLFAGKWS